MLNLNLNTNLTTTTATGRGRSPFFPYANPDPYASSLVVAIPGQIFYNPNDRTPLFGATTSSFYDASPSVRGSGTQVPLSVTGSNASLIGSVNGSPWGTNYGYNSSLLVPAKAALNAGTGSAFRITTSSNWVVECWVSFPSASTDSNPNHFLLNKVVNPNIPDSNNSYSVSIVSTFRANNIDDGNYPTPVPQYPISGGLAVQVFNTSITKNDNYYTYWPPTAVSQSYAKNGWYHMAVSMQIQDYGGVLYKTYRGFVNGVKIMEQYTGAYGGGTPAPQPQANAGATTPMLLLGNVYDSVILQRNQVGTPNTVVTQSAAIFQDFRFYNGTNKNYTASFDVNTVVKPIIIGSAY